MLKKSYKICIYDSLLWKLRENKNNIIFVSVGEKKKKKKVVFTVTRPTLSKTPWS